MFSKISLPLPSKIPELKISNPKIPWIISIALKLEYTPPWGVYMGWFYMVPYTVLWVVFHGLVSRGPSNSVANPYLQMKGGGPVIQP